MTISLTTRNDITLDVYESVAWEGKGVTLSDQAGRTMADARTAFERLMEHPDVVIYGVTSGYGQNAHLRFTPEERLAHARRGMGPPSNSFSENIQPFETLELCGIAKTSIPCCRRPSRCRHKSSGLSESNAE